MANDAFQIEALAVVNSPENNLNFRIKAEPVTTGADAMVYVWFLFTYISGQETRPITLDLLQP